MVHCLVKNEENWIWYAINSVIDYVDKILVFDTGSTDRTVEIVKSIKSSKIIIEEKGNVDRAGVTKMRQQMLERCDTDWFLILDGDEVWPKAGIKELVGEIQNAGLEKEVVVVGSWWCFGDVYHYYEEPERLRHPKAPTDLLGWKSGRAIKRIKGLHCVNLYPLDSYADKNGLNVAYWSKKRHLFLKEKYFHMSLLPRSSSRIKDKEVILRGQKTRFHRGFPFPPDTSYPEVFYLKRPSIVPSPWRRLTLADEIKGLYFRAENLIERIK